jgi:hypothetical protein
MPVMLERWNDDRMDALAVDVAGLGSRVGVLDTKVDNLDAKVDDLGGRMEKGFERVDAELREQRQEMREQRNETKAGFEAVHRTMVGAAIGLSSTVIACFAALIVLIATQL